MSYNLAQTFYLDAQSVAASKTAFVTAVDLFFYKKPTENKTKSGIAKPGVSVYLCTTKSNNSPDLENVSLRFIARKEYDNINVDTTGNTATKFVFDQPIYLKTNLVYGILIKFDGNDTDFNLWYNKAGQSKLGTDTLTQVSSGKVDGYLYNITNGNQLTPQTDADLSFKVYVAKFTTSPTTLKFTNRNYEILKIDPITNKFYGGEVLYEQRANNTGTVSISSSSKTLTGTGTSFATILQAGNKFVITDGTAGNTTVRTVVSVTNATSMVIDELPSFSNTSGAYYRTVVGSAYYQSGQIDHIVIQDSTANASVYLSVGSKIVGVDSQAQANVVTIKTYAINSVVPNMTIVQPADTAANVSMYFANTTYGVSAIRSESFVVGERQFIYKYPAVVASRTTEVTSGTPFKSVTGSILMSTLNEYTSPFVRKENMDLFAETFTINNDATNEYLGQGNAKTRYISKPISLADDQIAEDLKVYIRAYKPANTDIKLYARIKNNYDNESFDLKNWTELTPSALTKNLKSATNGNDYLELQYDLPYEPTGTLVAGKFTTTGSSAVVTGTSGAVNTSIAIGSVVRLYSASTPNTYFIDTVTTSNTTTFTVSSAVSNTSVVGSGFLVDVVTRKNSAFLDVQKQNVTTYFNGSLARFRGYDMFAIKIVLLSENGYSVPYVDDLRAVAVSA